MVTSKAGERWTFGIDSVRSLSLNPLALSAVPADLEMIKKPGTAQVGAISKAQKDSKTTFSTTGDNKSSQNTKIEKKKFRIFFEIFFRSFR